MESGPFSTLDREASTTTDTASNLETAVGLSGSRGAGPLPQRGRCFALERRTLRRVLARIGSPPIAVRLWDGSEVCVTSAALARLQIRCRRALWRVLLDPQVAFGDAYAVGDLDVEGDLVGFLRLVQERIQPVPQRQTRNVRRWHGDEGITLANSLENVSHHYNIGNDFYRLWLDRELAYTCAYFKTGEESLEQAQIDKFDHVCRKLRLRPGETVIEAGCGWGGLALHMARKYGVTVRAYNISTEQLAYARQRAREENLDDKVEFIEADWRNIDGACDAFVSVGMLEHVGIENYPHLGEVIHRVLRPDGRGLIHSIGRNFPSPLNGWICERIFPGAQPAALSEMMSIFEGCDFSVQDVENLRFHYARTLAHWLERYERNVEQVRATFDETFVRTWRLYLASSMVAFECGSLQLFQIAFTHNVNRDLPWTRQHLYEADEPACSAGPARKG